MLANLVNSWLEKQLFFLRLEFMVGLNNVLLRVLTIPHAGVEIEALIAVSGILRQVVVESFWRKSQLNILLLLHF